MSTFISYLQKASNVKAGSAAYAVAVMAGVLIPENKDEHFALAQSFAQLMADWNSQVRAVGSMPLPSASANQLLYSVLWVFMPIYWIPMFHRHYVDVVKQNFQMHFQSRPYLILILCGWVLLLWIALHPGGDQNHRLTQFMFGNQFTRSLSAPWLVFGVGWLTFSILGTLLAWSRNQIHFENLRNS